MFNRIKAIKTLFLEKLDTLLHRVERLDEMANATRDLTAVMRRLEGFAEAQLANETALLEASIRTLQLLQPPRLPSPSPLPSSSPWVILLGSVEETQAVHGWLVDPMQHFQAQIQTMAWEWDHDLTDPVLLEASHVMICKIPTEAAQWERLQQLRHTFPGSLGVFAWIPTGDNKF